jgi:hypothetical protein
MYDLILDQTIVSAKPIDFWPMQQKGDHAFPACFDLHLEPGLLALTHAAMPDSMLITSTVIRIAAPGLVNMDQLHKQLAFGGALRSALVDLRRAAIFDRGIFAACSAVKNELETLSEAQSSCSAAQDRNESCDLTLQPYDRWWYGVDRSIQEANIGSQRMRAFPFKYVGWASKNMPDLVIYDLRGLLAEGLSPVMAEIGVPKNSADYGTARFEWIEIAIESLIASIEEMVKGWPVMPGEPFQNVVRLDDHLFFITLDTVDGVTVASSSASKQSLEQFLLDVHQVGHSHLAHGLALLRRAVV